jgi:uncharacterized protein
MKITVKVHPKSSQNKVVELTGSEFEVYVTKPPEKNQANQAVVEALAAHFDVPKSSISILAGHKSKSKIVEVLKD